MWSTFVAYLRDDDDNITGVVTVVVDGETIKADTWYEFDGVRFVEEDHGKKI